MDRKVRIGIIGTGFARKVQIPSFLECDDAEIVSIASGHLENAAATAKEFEVRHSTDRWQDIVERDDVDLVCVTTPPATHHEIVLGALESGKHVLCEKPIALNARQAREMIAKAEERRALALIDHELRFLPGRQKAFAMIREGAIGKIFHVKCNFRAPHRGGGGTPWSWWSDKQAGGGALGAIGSHSIDSLLWLVGADVARVFCQLQTHVKHRFEKNLNQFREVTSDDEAILLLRLAESRLTEDATAMISISMLENPKFHHRIELFGTEGALRIEARGELYVTKAGEPDWTRIPTDLCEPVDGVPDTGFSRGFRCFAPQITKAIREGHSEIPHAATFADGLRVQLIIDAAHQSNETGCAVSLG